MKLFSIVLILTFTVQFTALADDDGFGEGSSLQTDLGEGTFMSEDGSLSQEDDLGGGQYAGEDGSLTTLDDAGGGESFALDGTPVIAED